MINIDLSSEQSALINALMAADCGNTYLLHAGPGSGKTTTIAAAAKALEDQRILILVFNVAAKDTLKARIMNDNVRIFTFDSFAAMLKSQLGGKRRKKESTYSAEYSDSLDVLKASGSKSKKCLQYDWMFLDEAQDISVSYAAYVAEIKSQCPNLKTLVAGDPRQTLYSGCTFFNELLTRDDPTIHQFTLTTNFRSAVSIVDMINKFGRESAINHLHIDQVAASDEDGRVNIIRVRSIHDYGRAAAKCAASNPPGSTMCLGLVSIVKWGTESVVNQIREEVFRRHHNIPIYIDAVGDNGVVIATTMKVKGLEADHVVILGAGADYSKFKSTIELSQLIYVALSRAKKSVTIILPVAAGGYSFTTDSNAYRLLRPITNVRTVDSTRETTFADFAKISVTDKMDGLLQSPISYEVKELRTIGSLTYDNIVQNDADFVGILMEAHVAAAMGVKMYRSIDLEVRYINNNDIPFIDGRTVFAQKLAADHLIAIRGQAINPVYLHAYVRYVININREWTVSERLRNITVGGEFIRDFRAMFGVDTPFDYNKKMIHSCAEKQEIHFIPDIKFYDQSGAVSHVVELKYVNALTNDHRKQAAIYDNLIKPSRGTWLINMRTGECERIENRAQDVGMMARVLMYSKQGREIALTRDTLMMRPLFPLYCIAAKKDDITAAIVVSANNYAHIETYVGTNFDEWRRNTYKGALVVVKSGNMIADEPYRELVDLTPTYLHNNDTAYDAALHLLSAFISVHM